MSTHGGSGYMNGTLITILRYIDEPEINIRGEFLCVCGQHGEASPTGWRRHQYSFRENPIKWFTREIKCSEPTWPDWIGKKYVYIERRQNG